MYVYIYLQLMNSLSLFLIKNCSKHKAVFRYGNAEICAHVWSDHVPSYHLIYLQCFDLTFNNRRKSQLISLNSRVDIRKTNIANNGVVKPVIWISFSFERARIIFYELKRRQIFLSLKKYNLRKTKVLDYQYYNNDYLSTSLDGK